MKTWATTRRITPKCPQLGTLNPELWQITNNNTQKYVTDHLKIERYLCILYFIL